ncbi:hypothetical protein R3I94_014034 [Phoxinus phoxinus]|uniref:Uncharacterized protein n=1 Tax=Phoxinus phoxinus TaxID=58324 RepID=A0AAN9CSA6_9TELE
MSKVLMAMEKGTLSDYKGKKLDDIEIDPNEQLEAQGDSMSSDEEDCSDLSQTTAPAETDQPVQSDQSVSQEDQCSSNAPKKKWEDSEVKAVERHMMKFIKTCKVPEGWENVKMIKQLGRVIRCVGHRLLDEKREE